VAGVVYVPYYATVFRQETFAAKVAEIAPLTLRYGAAKYQLHRSQDDRYRITLMAWFESKKDFYRWYDGPEMIEFRARNSGHFQIPVVYMWYDELAAGELGPQVEQEPAGAPEPEPEPQVVA
jgi:hypothetical protein